MGQKLNCWEIKRCGCEPSGANVGGQGVCPASVEKKLDAVHGGRNAGRSCWVVTGTLCDGTVQGIFASKFERCEKCEVYTRVREEEYPNFKYSSSLLRLLRE